VAPCIVRSDCPARAIVCRVVLVCHAARQLAIQNHQECMQVVRSTKVVRRIPTESNGTPAMDLGFEYIHIRRYTNRRGIEQDTHP